MSAFEVTPSALSNDLGGRTTTRPLASSQGVSNLLLTMGPSLCLSLSLSGKWFAYVSPFALPTLSPPTVLY